MKNPNPCAYDLIARIVLYHLQIGVVYLMVDLQGEFIIDYAAGYVVAMTGGAMGAVVGASFRGDRSTASQFLPLIIIPNLLFSGFFVSPDSIPVYLRWVQYVVPLGYGLRIILLEEFEFCKDEPNCVQLIDSVDASYDDEWFYWLILGVMFVVFRFVALMILQRSASIFF